MNEKLLKLIEREVLGWARVFKKRDDLIRSGQAISHPRSRTAGRRRATGYEARKTYPEPWNFST